MNQLDGGHNGPMPIMNVIGIIAFLIATAAFMFFMVNIYWTVWIATEAEISFPPLGLVTFPLCALFVAMSCEAYFRNIKKVNPPPWLFTASKYSLIAMVAAFVLGPLVIAPVAGSHLSAAGYSRMEDGRTGLDRRLWQKWHKRPLRTEVSVPLRPVPSAT
ncbi:MAG: hypothetical protein ACFB2Z_08715 [Maricaulaceae bacterium]